MNTSGEAAEQVMRMSLEGAEILIKLTGSGAKNAAVLLYSIYKEQNKTRGKKRLTNMLRSGKPLKVYTFKRDNLEKFKEVAKEYGILYTVLKEKEDKDGVFDVLVRADDDSKLARVIERFKFSGVDTAEVRTSMQKEKAEKEEATRTAPAKEEEAKESAEEPEKEKEATERESAPDELLTEQNLASIYASMAKRKWDPEKDKDKLNIFDQIRSIKNQDKNESKKEVEIDSGMSLFNL